MGKPGFQSLSCGGSGIEARPPSYQVVLAPELVPRSPGRDFQLPSVASRPRRHRQLHHGVRAAAPAKGPLLVTGSRNRADIARLRALAAELAAGPYGLTPALFVWRGGKFVVFDGK